MSDFASWKSRGRRPALARQHGIEASRIPELEWRQWFVAGLSPIEAADQASVHYLNRLPTPARVRWRVRGERDPVPLHRPGNQRQLFGGAAGAQGRLATPTRLTLNGPPACSE
jgi:hypothetical protein